jgi:glycosyltransferase involved in cell wall biosynthesis
MTALPAGVLVSVVIETVTVREHASPEPVADRLQRALDGVARQTFPRERIETIVVLDQSVDAGVTAELQRRHPFIKLAFAPATNYFAAKNAGAQMATGSIVALLDGDCEPAPDWLELMVSQFEENTGVVVGRTTYAGRSLAARTFTVPDLANVQNDRSGAATGVMLNNTGFRREILLSHPLDARIARNGGCYLLYHTLRGEGVRMVYDRRVEVSHEVDVSGTGFIRKHFARGYDGVTAYRCDDRGVLKGTAWFRRFGGLSLFPITARRIMLDWIRLARDRRQIGFPLLALPYFHAVAAGTRLIELAGSLAALFSKRPIGEGR